MILLISILSFAAWFYLIVFHGRFWSSRHQLRPEDKPSGKARVAIVIPARDEAESIRQSIASLLVQDYPGPLSLLLVDDNSTDGTATLAASLGGGERLTIVQGQPLPVGWSGKLWAVHQGLQQRQALASDYILLTDADIQHAPGHISALVARAERDGLDLVSEMVRLRCKSWAERALIPAFIFFFQMLYPFDWVADSKRKLAGAAGGTMLVRRTALERIGGVESIRQQLIDDCSLAARIKSTGGSIWLGHAEDTLSLRVYADWREIWNMIARTAYVQLRHSLLLLAGCVTGMALLYIAPPALALSAHGPARWLGLAAWAFMAASFLPTLRRYHRSPLWGIALPAIALFYMGATLASAWRHYAGRGGGWKNRTYTN